jgi:hypothetical protein
LIQGDPADRSIDYVVNGPALDAPVLRARYRPGKTDLTNVEAVFPDRAIYLADVKSGEFFEVKMGRLRRLFVRQSP